MKKFKAVLFDFDGTLADSMKDNYLAWKKAFHYLGVEIKRQDYFPLEGMKLTEIAKNITSKYKANININSVVESKNRYYLKNHSFKLYEGAQELIDQIKNKGKLIAIVSASPREKLEKIVPKEFLRKFDAVVSGDDTKNGKPDPEPYIVTMRTLDIAPDQCIVVENAPLGIRAAKAAGAYCIALTTTLDKEYLKEADEIVNSYEELKKLLLF